MAHAFPHDELKPITRTWTDSLGELGNLNREHLSSTYEGVALTLIDATSTLAVVGNVSEFRRAVSWLETNLDFDVDVRVNAFECNIRVLGGLLSAHVLALGDSRSWGPARGAGRGGWLPGGGKRASAFDRDDGAGVSVGDPLAPAYSGGLLDKALDLGERLLRAFDTETGMPYAWVNLRDGVRAGETTETNVAAVGSFALEFGTLRDSSATIGSNARRNARFARSGRCVRVWTSSETRWTCAEGRGSIEAAVWAPGAIRSSSICSRRT